MSGLGAYDRAAVADDPRVGASVEVRTRYLSGQWAHGYEIAEVLARGYRVRCLGSLEVLAEVFDAADLRPESGG